MSSLAQLRLAKSLRPAGPMDGPLELTYGQVTATALTASPPTITVQCDGFTAAGTETVTGIWPSNSYTPAVGDIIICLFNGVDTIVLGVPPSA